MPGENARAAVRRTIVTVLLALYALVSVYPLVYMVLYSLKTNSEIFLHPFSLPRVPQFGNYVSAVTEFNIARYFGNSIEVTGITILIVIGLSSMFAYAAARMKWKMRRAAMVYIAAGMFIPPQIVLIPLVLLIRNLRLTDTLSSLIIPYVSFGLSFGCIMFYGLYRSIPVELEEAASIDGASVLKTFFRIIFPLATPAVATVSIFTFLSSWNEFMMAVVLITSEAVKTLPLGLVRFQGQFSTNWGAMGACLTVASIPTVVMYLILGQRVEKAISVSGAVKG